LTKGEITMSKPVRLSSKPPFRGCIGECNNCPFKRLHKQTQNKYSDKQIKESLKPTVKKLLKPIIKNMVKSLTPFALRQDLKVKDLLFMEPKDPYRQETIRLDECYRERFKPEDVDDYFSEVRFMEHGLWYYITWLFTRVFPGTIYYFKIYYWQTQNGELAVKTIMAMVEDPVTGNKELISVPNWLATVGLLPWEFTD
jgi:hypothetical protein